MVRENDRWRVVMWLSPGVVAVSYYATEEFAEMVAVQAAEENPDRIVMLAEVAGWSSYTTS